MWPERSWNMIEALPFSNLAKAFHILSGGVLKIKGLSVVKISGLDLRADLIWRLSNDILTSKVIFIADDSAAIFAVLSESSLNSISSCPGIQKSLRWFGFGAWRSSILRCLIIYWLGLYLIGSCINQIADWLSLNMESDWRDESSLCHSKNNWMARPITIISASLFETAVCGSTEEEVTVLSAKTAAAPHPVSGMNEPLVKAMIELFYFSACVWFDTIYFTLFRVRDKLKTLPIFLLQGGSACGWIVS